MGLVSGLLVLFPIQWQKNRLSECLDSTVQVTYHTLTKNLQKPLKVDH